VINKLPAIILVFLLVFSFRLNAQDSSKIAHKEKKTEISFVDKVKITGYIQTQFQAASAQGIATLAGGNFAPNTQNRFTLRRARLKAAFSSTYTDYVIQLAASETSMGIDEAYIKFSEPWLNAIAIKAGIFDRPFGYEVSYSSSKIEYCERSRVVRTLLPDEKDIGIMLSLHDAKIPVLNLLYLDAGIFNGAGPKHGDFDSRKDVIGHLYFTENLFKNNVLLSGGYSYHYGGFNNQRNIHYMLGSTGFEAIPNDTLALSPRNYHGLDGQLTIKSMLGQSSFRTEYIFGMQAATEFSNITPDVAPVNSSNKPIPSYFRNFKGGYILFLQDITKTNLQLVCRYDWFDPNKKIAGKQVGGMTNTGKADMKYATIGFGCNYLATPNLKLTAYYDYTINENTNLTAWTKDINDNVFTLRCQYKF
jgi:phosphate-selective porin